MRGQVYSLIAVLMIIPMMLFVGFYISSTQSMKYGTVEKIIADQQFQIANSLDYDLGRAIDISGKRAILAGINEVTISGTPMANATHSIDELMINGTWDGNHSFVMENNTLSDWRDAAMNTIEWFTIIVDYKDRMIENYDSYNIRFRVGTDINISDNMNTSRITKSDTKDHIISIEGLEDPIFPLNTGGYVRRTIDRYNYSYYTRKFSANITSSQCSGQITFDAGTPDSGKILVVQDGTGIGGFGGVIAESEGIPGTGCYAVGVADAVDSINSTVQESGYMQIYIDNESSGAWSMPIRQGLEQNMYYSGAGPDMIRRLEGKLESAPSGLETFVNIPEMEALAIETKPLQSRIAYLYFSNQTYNGDQVRGMPDWFMIGAADAAAYDLTELLES